MVKTVVLMMGLPRSGKSTKAAQLRKEKGWPIVNRDSIRLAMHGQRYVSEAEPMVKAMAIIMVRALFNAGHDVIVVDETSIKLETRKFWGSGNSDSEWEVKVLHIATSAEVCLERADLTNDERIKNVIIRMNEDFEPLEENEVELRESELETLGQSS
jgi:predicted kinase